MATTTSIKNWEISDSPEVLNHIHNSDINIVIHDRDISSLYSGVNRIMSDDINFRNSGSIAEVLSGLKSVISPSIYPELVNDIAQLLHRFESLTGAESFRILLATVKTDMCRKFHTDINDLRLLCTYSGPGTVWLSEDNIDHKALENPRAEGTIVIDESKIRQANTGSVVVLKGAIYPIEGTRPVVHRSPTIEESGARRLILRIDTNEFLNYN